jgi:cytochrome c oxidase cbb3-type subunit 2
MKAPRESLAIVVGALALLMLATITLVILPAAQLSNPLVPEGLQPYTAQQQAGRDQYVSLGCVYCHTQQPRSPNQAPDHKRGWGRAPIPADYTFDYPHQLGTMRTGPDLMNIGARQPSETWHLMHLYQPRSVADWSNMPAYPFLFELKEAAEEGDTTVSLPGDFGPESGVIVASQKALDLVAYLIAMDRTYPTPQPGGKDAQ